jgi:hypothetical protein
VNRKKHGGVNDRVAEFVIGYLVGVLVGSLVVFVG